MKRLTHDQQKAVVKQWQRAAPALARAREEELAVWQYDPSTVNALLDIGAKSPPKANEPNGLVEMQRRFMQLARKQGLLPAVKEASASCGDGGVPVEKDSAGRKSCPAAGRCKRRKR